MIDTDKYKGHTEGPWKFGEDDEGIYLTADALTIWETSERECPVCAEGEGWQPAQYDCITRRLSDPDKALIADAPDLLTEVLRLREGIKQIARDYGFNAIKSQSRHFARPTYDVPAGDGIHTVTFHQKACLKIMELIE